MKKRLLRCAAMGLIAALLLSGCAPIVGEAPRNFTVYATFYPIYALTEMIVDGAPDLELHCLVQPQDDCLRSYALSDWDLYLLAYSADAVIAAGQGLEGYSDALESLAESSVPLIEVMYGIELYQGNEIDEDSHFSGDNPHAYLSIDGAIEIARRIAAMLSMVNEVNADVFERNFARTQEKLEDLKLRVQEQTKDCAGIKAAVLNEALFYVAQGCGLEIVTWFERESGTMLYGTSMDECLNRLRESSAQMVLIEQQAPQALQTALEEAGYAVARLDILSTRGEADGMQGYFEAMEENARAIAQAVRMNE